MTVSERIQLAALSLAQAARLLPLIAPHCSAMPEIDASDEDSVSLRWTSDRPATSYSLHIYPHKVTAILSQPLLGGGFGEDIPVDDTDRLLSFVIRDDADAFLRRYGPPATES